MELNDCIDSASSINNDTSLKETNAISAEIPDESVLPLNSKDELNWVENEIVVVDSLTDKVVTESVDRDEIDNNCAENPSFEQSVNETIDNTSVEKRSSSLKSTSENKLWDYFTEHNSSQLRCNLCLGLFLYQSNALQLLRHVEVVHRVSVLPESKVVDVASAADCHVDSDSSKGSGNPISDTGRRESLSDKNENGKDLSASSAVHSTEDVAIPAKLKESSKIWKCFTVLESGRIRCNLCCRVLSRHSNKSKMLRHLRTNHCDNYRQIVEPLSGDDGVLRNSDRLNDKQRLKKSKRLSRIWDCFTDIGAAKVQCKFCSILLKCTNGSAANLKRHLMAKHKNVFSANEYNNKDVKKGSTPDPRQKNTTSFVLEIIQQGDKCLITNAVLHDESNQNALAELTVSTASELNRSNMRQSSGESVLCDERFSSANIRCQVWDYFTKSYVDSEVYCNICSHVLPSSKSTIELFNHLASEHGIDVSKTSKSQNAFDFKVYATKPEPHNDENINFEYNLNSKITIDDISSINLSSILRSERSPRLKEVKRNVTRREITNCWLWKYYVKLYRDKAMCNLCDKTFTYKLGQTSNLIKHLQVQHKFMYINTNTKSIARNRKRNMALNQRMKINNTDIVWNYFTKLDDNKAECNLCERVNVLYCSPGSRTNLMKHLRRRHRRFLDLNYSRESETMKDENAVLQATRSIVNRISNDDSNHSSPGIDMKTLFDYFSDDQNLRDYIKFENDQISCKLCTGMFLFDDLLNFEYTIKYHVQTCHVNSLSLDRSVLADNSLSADRASETSDEVEVMSSSSYNELEAISNEINSYGK